MDEKRRGVGQYFREEIAKEHGKEDLKDSIEKKVKFLPKARKMKEKFVY